MCGNTSRAGETNAARSGSLVQVREPGQTQARRDPARDSTLEFLGETTIAPVTRSIRNIPSEVLLSTADGLPSECAINLDHIQTVTKSKLGGLITRLGESKMDDVRKALLFALGF